jgi:hypothetical protein
MRRSIRRWSRAGFIAGGAVLAALALGGCAQSLPAAPIAPDAQPASEVDCRTEGTWWGPDAPDTPDPAVPVPGRVPAGFEPVAALRCVVDLSPGVVNETTPEPVMRVQRLEGDLGPLLDALAQADDPVPPDIMCTADMELVPPLWLEDADGAVIPVHYPRDACGKTKPAVRDAVERLDLVSTTDAPAVTG